MKLAYFVTFQFGGVIFDGFVAVIERFTVIFCPSGAENDFFLVELISLMFLDNHFGVSPTARSNKIWLRDGFSFSIFGKFFAKNHDFYQRSHPESGIC